MGGGENLLRVPTLLSGIVLGKHCSNLEFANQSFSLVFARADGCVGVPECLARVTAAPPDFGKF